MKSAYRRRRSRIIATSIIAIIVLAFGVLLLGAYLRESSIINNAASEIEGKIPEYNWSADDRFDINKYPVIQTKDGGINVMQLTDLHYRNQGTFGSIVGVNYITDGFLKYQIKNMVNKEKPDLIVITGDLITFYAADFAYRELASFFDSLNVPWAVVMGNHDAEYNADKAELTRIMVEESKNGLTQYGPTNLTGLGNYIIRVNDANGNLSQALVMMDSNDWVNSDGGDKRFSTETAGITAEQMDWYEWAIAGLKSASGNVDLPTSLYTHIQIGGDGTEDYTAQFKAGGTDYLFSGHTHADGNVTERNGVTLVTANKAGINYQDNGSVTGGTMIELKADGSAVIRNISHPVIGKYESVTVYGE